MKKAFIVFLLLFSLNKLNAQSPPPPPPAPATDSAMVEYLGKFKFPDGSPVTEITMVLENGNLIAQTPMGNSEFKKTDTKDVFDIVVYSGLATFRRNTDGKIIALRIQVQDLDMEGTRSEGK